MPKKRSTDDVEFDIEKAVELKKQGFQIKVIAQRFGTCSSTISKRIKEYNRKQNTMWEDD